MVYVRLVRSHVDDEMDKINTITITITNHKNFTPQVSRDLWNGGTSV